MKIVVLSGSPRKGANTDTMVEAFAETAREGGNTVEVVRVASKKIAGCLGCQYCFADEGTCVQKNDMADVIESLIDADMVVFASPIYWFDIIAQEKATIDRLYAFGATGFPFTKTALLTDSHSEGVYDAAIAMYKSTCAYCKWEDQGIVTIWRYDPARQHGIVAQVERGARVRSQARLRTKRSAWQSALVGNACYPYQEIGVYSLKCLYRTIFKRRKITENKLIRVKILSNRSS